MKCEELCSNCVEENLNLATEEHRILSCTVNESGQHHSFNDEPAFIVLDGLKIWFRNGKLHRENGPSKEFWDKKHPEMYWYYEGRSPIRLMKEVEVGQEIQTMNGNGIVLSQKNEKVYLILLNNKKVFGRRVLFGVGD